MLFYEYSLRKIEKYDLLIPRRIYIKCKHRDIPDYIKEDRILVLSCSQAVHYITNNPGNCCPACIDKIYNISEEEVYARRISNDNSYRYLKLVNKNAAI